MAFIPYSVMHTVHTRQCSAVYSNREASEDIEFRKFERGTTAASEGDRPGEEAAAAAGAAVSLSEK